MSNVLNKDPIAMDTAEAAFGAATLLVLTKVVWKAPTSLGDALVLKDANGRVIVDTICELDGQSQVFNFNPPKSYDGLNLVTLTSGTVYIYRS